MKTYTIVIPNGVTFELAARGNYVRVKTAPVDLVIINPDANGDERVEASQGDDFEFSTFERLSISHSAGTAQTFKIVISRDKKSNSTPVSGATAVSSLPATAVAFSQVSFNVTNASQQLRAAKADRRYLLVQNNDASAVLRVSIGTAATATVGVRVPPGAALEIENYVPNGIIYAMMETATAATSNVIVWEG